MKTVILILILSITSSSGWAQEAREKNIRALEATAKKRIDSLRKEKTTIAVKPDTIDRLWNLRVKARVRGYEDDKMFQDTFKQIRKTFPTTLVVDPKVLDEKFKTRSLKGLAGNGEAFEKFYQDHVASDPVLKNMSIEEVAETYIDFSAIVYAKNKRAWRPIWGATFFHPFCNNQDPDGDEIKSKLGKVKTQLEKIDKQQ